MFFEMSDTYLHIHLIIHISSVMRNVTNNNLKGINYYNILSTEYNEFENELNELNIELDIQIDEIDSIF